MIKLVDYDPDDEASEAFEAAKAEAARAAFREKFCREMYGVGYSVVKESSDDEVRGLASQKLATESSSSETHHQSLDALKQMMAKQAFVKSATILQPGDAAQKHISSSHHPEGNETGATAGSEYRGIEEKINSRFVSKITGVDQPHPISCLRIAMETRFTDFITGHLNEGYFSNCVRNAEDQLGSLILQQFDQPQDWSVSFDRDQKDYVVRNKITGELFEPGRISIDKKPEESTNGTKSPRLFLSESAPLSAATNSAESSSKDLLRDAWRPCFSSKESEVGDEKTSSARSSERGGKVVSADSDVLGSHQEDSSKTTAVVHQQPQYPGHSSGAPPATFPVFPSFPRPQDAHSPTTGATYSVPGLSNAENVPSSKPEQAQVAFGSFALSASGDWIAAPPPPPPPPQPVEHLTPHRTVAEKRKEEATVPIVETSTAIGPQLPATLVSRKPATNHEVKPAVRSPSSEPEPQEPNPKPTVVEIGPQLPPGFRVENLQNPESSASHRDNQPPESVSHNVEPVALACDEDDVVDPEFEGLVAELNSLVEVQPEQEPKQETPEQPALPAACDSPRTTKRKTEEELDRFLEELENEIAPKKPKPEPVPASVPDQDLDVLFAELTEIAGVSSKADPASSGEGTTSGEQGEAASASSKSAIVLAQSPRIFPESKADGQADDALGDEYALFMAELGEAVFTPDEPQESTEPKSAEKGVEKKKKKKTTHLKSNLMLKKKGIDSLVSKWQSVSKSARR